MQQTSKYQFNLVENTDDFSPTPLNQNMEKVEEELEGIEESLTEGLAEVMANLGSGGQNARVAYGSYAGTGTYGSGSPTSLTFDFTPVAVFIRAAGPMFTAEYVRGCSTGSCCWNDGYTVNVTWTNNGVSWYHNNGSEFQNNATGYTYYYVAIGYSG